MSATDPAEGPHRTDTTHAVTPRRGPDLLTLAVGLSALGIAGTTLLTDVTWLPELDARWILAAVALALGLTLITTSLRP